MPTSFVEQLLSATKTGALYGREHPQRTRLARSLATAFATLASGARVELEARADGALIVNGEEATGPEAREIARRLVVGGVCLLDLAPAIGVDELDGLAELLALDFEALRLEDDLATLLWERGYPNIRFELVSVPSEETETESESESGFTSDVPKNEPPDPLRPEVWRLDEFAPTPQELSTFEEEIALQTANPLPSDTGSILCQIISLERKPECVRVGLDRLAAVIDACLCGGRFRSAVRTAQLLDRLGNDPQSLTEEKSQLIAECRRGFLSRETLARIVPVLEAGRWDDAEAASTYLVALSDDAVSDLVAVYLRLGREDARAIVRRALVAKLREDLEPATRVLGSLAPGESTELVRLLGEVGSRDAVPVLRELMRGSTLEIRLEATSALASIGGAHALGMVARALSDPAREVRCRAAEALAGAGAREGLDPLLKEMLRAEFRRRDLDERKVFFRALGSTNVPEVLPFLRRLLTRKGWAFIGRKDDERLCAATALVVMTHAEALALKAELRRGGADVQRLLDEAEKQAGMS